MGQKKEAAAPEATASRRDVEFPSLTGKRNRDARLRTRSVEAG